LLLSAHVIWCASFTIFVCLCAVSLSLWFLSLLQFAEVYHYVVYDLFSWSRGHHSSSGWWQFSSVVLGLLAVAFVLAFFFRRLWFDGNLRRQRQLLVEPKFNASELASESPPAVDAASNPMQSSGVTSIGDAPSAASFSAAFGSCSWIGQCFSPSKEQLLVQSRWMLLSAAMRVIARFAVSLCGVMAVTEVVLALEVLGLLLLVITVVVSLLRSAGGTSVLYVELVLSHRSGR
jgi:hypothetical protein